MAPIDREDIQRRLKELHKKLSLIKKKLDLIAEDCYANGDKVFPLPTLTELMDNQQATMTDFYKLLRPFYQGDIQLLRLSQLPDEVFPVVVGTDKEAELVGLAERLEGFQKTGDEMLERIMGNLRTKETQETEEAGNVLRLRLSDVAMRMYGFPVEITMDIEKSLQNGKLVQDDTQFLEDEAEIGLDDFPEYGKAKGQELTELKSWVMIQKLKMKFKKLKKKLYSEDPSNSKQLVRETFVRVIRNWIFHIESVTFHLLYEAYEMLAGIEVAETSFPGFVSDLKNLMQDKKGMVPIIVYKALKLMGGSAGSSMSTGERSRNSRQMSDQMTLKEALDSTVSIVVRLTTVLVTASLANNTRLMSQAEVDRQEDELNHIEEDVTEVERKIKWVMSRLEE